MSFKKYFKKSLVLFSSILILSIFFSGCGNQELQKPSPIIIEDGIKQALKTDGYIFDKISNFQYVEVDITEDDMEQLKSKYASRVDYIKYNTTFDLVSAEMDMSGNYSAIFCYNNGSWSFSFGYLTNKDEWEYKEKAASFVDKQRMLDDLKNTDFGSFQRGYVGNSTYSSIGSIESRKYNETVHSDIIKTQVVVETDFAVYQIPIQMTYFFVNGEWILGGVDVSNEDEWNLIYNDGSAPQFLSDSIILSYLTTETNFLTYVCNLDYVKDYSIRKESEIANKESVNVIYCFSVQYEYIGTVNYNVEISYIWLDNEWGDAEPQVSFRDADFTEMIKWDWKNEDGSLFKFISSNPLGNSSYSLTGSYGNNNSVEIIANLNVPLRDNNWDASITDMNGNQLWDIPASSFALNLEYGAIIYNNKYYAPIQINVEEDIDNPDIDVIVNTSNEIIYNKDIISYDNQITKNNLMFKEITIDYEKEVLKVNGTIYNMSDGQSSYRVAIALFDENDMIISEGVKESDSILTPESSAIISVDINELSEEEYSKITRIMVYLSK